MVDESWVVGPTWAKDPETGEFLFPERTLGWGVVNWAYENLRTPGGPHAGEPFLPTMEQLRFLLWWYEVDERGKFTHRVGVLRRMKGWGKDPLAGVLALVELLGPVEFSHFSEKGEAVGKPRYDPWVQIAAVSQEQTRNTFTLFPSLLTDEAKQEYGLELHKTLIYDKRGKILEGVTSSPKALEGRRPTFLILNETQWWVEANDGLEMARVIEGNVTKAAYGSCRSLSICNAHIPGQGSVAELDWEAYLKVAAGQAVDTDMLYDALEAPASTPISEIPSPAEDPEGYERGVAELRRGLEIARGDAVWLDLDTIVASILDIRNPVSESRRKYLNQVNAAEDSWIAPAEWDRVAADVALQPGDRVTIGFDGSKSNDHTAVAVCRVDDGAVFLVRSWDPEKCVGGEIPREDVDATIRGLFERYDVVAFRADVHDFESYIDEWGKDFKRKLKMWATANSPVGFDMRSQKKKFALDCERFLNAVLDGEVSHDGDPRLRWYVLNCHRHPTPYDAVSIRKKSKDSKRKIDAAVCAVLAFGARQDFMLSKKYRGKGKGGAIV